MAALGFIRHLKIERKSLVTHSIVLPPRLSPLALYLRQMLAHPVLVLLAIARLRFLRLFFD